MKTLDQEQRSVARSMAFALLIAVIVLGSAGWLLPAPWRLTSPGNAMRLLVLLPVPLMVSIAAMARHRFFSAADIDGGAVGKGSDSAVRMQAIIQNTLEQTVLALAVYLGWINVAPVDRLSIVPAALLLFLIGRILFARGYRHGAPGRALGFALTFYTTLLLCLLGVVQWLYAVSSQLAS